MAPLLWGLVLAGCATARVPATLRSQDDLRPAPGKMPLYVLPDSAAARGREAWVHFTGDSMVVYRPLADAGGPQTYRRQARRLGASGLAIGGYTLADGRHVRFSGHVRRVGDQFEFQRRPAMRGLEKVETPDRFTLAASDVRSLDVELPDAGRTILVVTVVVLLGTTAFLLAVASSLREPLL